MKRSEQPKRGRLIAVSHVHLEAAPGIEPELHWFYGDLIGLRHVEASLSPDEAGAAGLAEAGSSITVESVTRYARRFDLAAVDQALLALRVAGKPLTHGHGAPLRLVVPGERGMEWVKWVAAVHVNSTSALWQPPLPLPSPPLLHPD